MFREVVVRMYAPNGAEIHVSLKQGVDPTDAAACLERMGLFPVPPDEFQRERRDQVGALVLRYHGGPEDEVPVLDVYFRHPGGYVDRFRSMVVYLDYPWQRDEIERILGISLEQLPYYDADAPLIRGERTDRDARYVVRVQGLWAVWRLNPASEEDDRAKKRLFLRWEVEGSVSVQLPGQTERPSSTVPDEDLSLPLSDRQLHSAILGVWGMHPSQENLAQARQILMDFFKDTVDQLTRRQVIGWAAMVRMTARELHLTYAEAARALRAAFPPGQAIRIEQVRAWLKNQTGQNNRQEEEA